MGSLPGKYTGALSEKELRNMSKESKKFIEEIDAARAKGELTIGNSKMILLIDNCRRI